MDLCHVVAGQAAHCFKARWDEQKNCDKKYQGGKKRDNLFPLGFHQLTPVQAQPPESSRGLQMMMFKFHKPVNSAAGRLLPGAPSLAILPSLPAKSLLVSIKMKVRSMRSAPKQTNIVLRLTG